MKTRSSINWSEKLENKQKPKLVNEPEKWIGIVGHGFMFVPAPLNVDEAIQKIPGNKLATVNSRRYNLAKKCWAGMFCPLTKGIFLNNVVNAVEENRKMGILNNSPYRGILKEVGEFNPKFNERKMAITENISKEDHVVFFKSENIALVKTLK